VLTVVAVPALYGVPSAGFAETVRPEVGKPLQEAGNLLRAQKYREALTKIGEADAVGGKTAYESYLIQRMRVSAESGVGDAAAAASALDAVVASGHATPAEKLQMIEAVAVAFYRNKEYQKAAQWAVRFEKEGGTDPAIRQMLVQSYYLSNDCASVSKELQPSAQSEGGHAPSEEDLQLLANCYQRLGDKGGYANAMEKLVTYYPKKDYWADLLSRTQGKPGFSDRLDLDLYRLKLLTGNLTSPNDFLEMAQLDLEAGYPAEAKKVVDQGFNTKILGTGPDAARQQRLRDLVVKSIADAQTNAAQQESEAHAAKEGDGLVNLGFAAVTDGKFDKGLGLMEQGIAKGNLKHPDEAQGPGCVAHRKGRRWNAGCGPIVAHPVGHHHLIVPRIAGAAKTSPDKIWADRPWRAVQRKMTRKYPKKTNGVLCGPNWSSS
jgi:hypothetical protein